MPPGLCDRLARSFEQRLELAIGGQGELLGDRSRQNPIAVRP